MIPQYDESQRKVMLQLAREAIRSFLNTREIISPPDLPFLKDPRAAFVTITIQGELRGCIGNTEPSLPLGEMVIEGAVAAAFRDPRFPPLSAQEFEEIEIEVSILSPFREIRDPGEIEVGKHGVLISSGYHRGLLLPQVATEHDWDRDTFLSYTCRKAGLPEDAWRNPETRIQIFSSEVFGEQSDENSTSNQ